MNRRRWLSLCCRGCTAAGLGAWNWSASAQDASYAVPHRFQRPENSTEEGGLWAMMDREERSMRRSALLVRDKDLVDYVQGIVCRLGGEHCPDVRTYIMRTPHFNASMAPNGLMQVWSGLMLRVENEAQLAAVLGHEIGHFLQRHSLLRLRDIKDKAAAMQVLGLFGAGGAVGQLAVAASAMGYQRDHEREADRIGAVLMHRAGYTVSDAAQVWSDLTQEMQIRDEGQPEPASASLFATHPPSKERQETLTRMATELPGGERAGETYRQRVQPFMEEWCADELKRGQLGQSIALFTRLLTGQPDDALLASFRGEAYRLRARNDDLDLAWKEFQAVARKPQPHPRAFRGIGLIARQRGQRAEAAAALRRYVELAPQAPDAPLMTSYVTEMTP